MSNHKLTLTAEQWDLLLLVLSYEQERYEWDYDKHLRVTGRKLATIINSITKYKRNTNQ